MVYISPVDGPGLLKRRPRGASVVSSLLFRRSCWRQVKPKPFNFNIKNNNEEEAEIKRKRKRKRMKMMKESRGTVDNDISNPITRHLHLDDNIAITPLICCSTRSSGSSLIVGAHDDLVCEILSRLPPKSLMRFKCVCKNWLFFIEQDTQLHDLHLKRSMIKTPPDLLIGMHLVKLKDDKEDWLLSANLIIQGNEVEAAIHTIRCVNLWVYDEILKPVNGLICFINFKSVFAVRVCNPCTREATPWIESTLLMEQKEKYDDVEVVDHCGNPKYLLAPNYGFGFDPATKEHKVISVWKISRLTKSGVKPRKMQTYHEVKARRQIVSICEILTVGHNSWRRIDDVPPYDLEGKSVYANGSIYWIGCDRHLKQNKSPEVIVAFDVGSEKFRVIPISFIFDQARDHQGRESILRPSLFEYDGCVAISFGNCGWTLKMWIFDDDFDKNKDNITSNKDWSEETIKLPGFFCTGRYQDLYFHVVAGTDRIILECYNPRGLMRRTNPTFYSYNRKTKTSQKVVFSGISKFPYCRNFLVTTFVESLYRVQKKAAATPYLDSAWASQVR